MTYSFSYLEQTGSKCRYKTCQNRIKSLGEVETHYCVLILGLESYGKDYGNHLMGKPQMKFLAHSVSSDPCPVISPSSLTLLLFNVLLNYALTSLNFLLNFKHSKMICILSSSSFLLSVQSSSPQIPNANSFLIG